MTEEEKRAHAKRIAEEALGAWDFAWLFESDELHDAEDEELSEIIRMIWSARVEIPAPQQ